MGGLLVGLAKSLGLAGLMAGILFLLYRQLLALKVFPKLTSRQGFMLLLIIVVLIFSASMVVIVPGVYRRTGFEALSLGKYKCIAESRPEFTCSLNNSDGGGVSLDFANPDTNGTALTDSFHGEMRPQDGIFVISLVNTFNAEPESADREETHTSTMRLRQTSSGILDGSWQIGTQTLSFHLEKSK